MSIHHWKLRWYKILQISSNGRSCRLILTKSCTLKSQILGMQPCQLNTLRMKSRPGNTEPQRWSWVFSIKTIPISGHLLAWSTKWRLTPFSLNPRLRGISPKTKTICLRWSNCLDQCQSCSPLKGSIAELFSTKKVLLTVFRWSHEW